MTMTALNSCTLGAGGDAVYLCDETITVFNNRYDPQSSSDKWEATVISGVSWYGTKSAGAGGQQLSPSNSIIIRIPVNADTEGKQYVEPIEYKRLDDVSGFFTLNEGDIIVRGEVDADFMTPAQAHKLYSGAIAILSVTDNRRAPNAPHWRVNGG